MAWRRPGDKSLSEPMMVRLPTYASLSLNELRHNIEVWDVCFAGNWPCDKWTTLHCFFPLVFPAPSPPLPTWVTPKRRHSRHTNASSVAPRRGGGRHVGFVSIMSGNYLDGLVNFGANCDISSVLKMEIMLLHLIINHIVLMQSCGIAIASLWSGHVTWSHDLSPHSAVM